LTALRHSWEASFAGRCGRSFLNAQGLDRAVVIASQAFTALIPLLLLVSALLPSGNATRVSDAVVRRLGLEGDAAASVERVFAQPEPGAVGALSLVLLVLSGVSLTRRLQRMYLTAWRVDTTVGVRGSVSAAVGLAVMLVEIALLSMVRGVAAQLRSEWALSIPISLLSGLVLWTSIPWLLLDRRVAWRRLSPEPPRASTVWPAPCTCLRSSRATASGTASSG
jgi:membrane protein